MSSEARRYGRQLGSLRPDTLLPSRAMSLRLSRHQSLVWRPHQQLTTNPWHFIHIQNAVEAINTEVAWRMSGAYRIG
jgi:hypothetical protein